MQSEPIAVPRIALLIVAVTTLIQHPAFADDASKLSLTSTDLSPLMFVLFASIASVVFGFLLRSYLLRKSAGTESMQRVGQAIRDGAHAYLFKQIRTMAPFVVLLAVGLFFLFRGQPHFRFETAIGISAAFVAGVICSYTAGYVGMGMATSGNQRTAFAALTSYKDALEIAFRSGAVAGLMTVGLGLLGATSIFFLFGNEYSNVLVGALEGFGFGGSLAALFMRVGGGIFTKAADVGADLVGKIEQDIPEDDPRNAATIADNVGDNVGDCAGMAADVFESYEVTLVAAIILGIGAGVLAHSNTVIFALILYPLVVHAVGIVASMIGIASVRGSNSLEVDPLTIIGRGLWLTAGIAVAGFAVAAFLQPQLVAGITLSGRTYHAVPFFLCTFLGVLVALVISHLTEHFTGSNRQPVTDVANAAKTGPATLILSGFSLGLESATWSAIAIALSIFAVVMIFPNQPILIAYGIALSGLGLLTTTGYVLAMDTFGPIADNANGIFEMSGALRDLNSGRESVSGAAVVARLDSAGNTTKALTKGFAIATAVTAAVALFRSFVSNAHLSGGLPLDNPRVFIGLLVGGAAPYLFSSFAINAVSRAASDLVFEVRRQFRSMPGIMQGTHLPDYARCVAIATTAAQRELLGPGVLAIGLPILVGFGLGAYALGGYLAGAILSGQLMAVFLANSGGAWDNAKKKIEDGMLGGKGSEAHKAGIIADTVGDPFKDTAGPALNPLIKVMNLVGVLISGELADMAMLPRIVIVVVSACALAGAIAFSKRRYTGGDVEQPAAEREFQSYAGSLR